MGQLQLETLFQLAGPAFVLMGLAYLLAYSSDVHDNSRDITFQTEDTKLARYTEYLRRICYKSRKRVHAQAYRNAIIAPCRVKRAVFRPFSHFNEVHFTAFVACRWSLSILPVNVIR